MFVLRGSAPTTRVGRVVLTRKFTSVKTFASVVARHRLGRGVKAVLYDPERWRLTPIREQRHVGAAMSRFVALAHRHHLIALVAPALDLVRTLDPMSRGRFTDRYLRLGIARAAARSHADVVVVQAQSQEARAGAYAHFMRRAVRQVRTAARGTRVYAGLSSGPTSGPVDQLDLVLAATGVLPVVQGFWLNAPSGPSALCPACAGGPVSLFVRVLTVVSAAW